MKFSWKAKSKKRWIIKDKKNDNFIFFFWIIVHRFTREKKYDEIERKKIIIKFFSNKCDFITKFVISIELKISDSINFESEISNSIETTNLNLEFFDLIDDYWTKKLS